MAGNFKIKPIRQGFNVRFVFARPILSWEHVGSRFINALYDSVSPKIPIAPNEVSFSNGPSIADVWVKYAVYGGASTIALYADRIALDFPALTGTDFAVAMDLVRTAHDIFPKLFPDQGCERIETQTAEHLEFIKAGDLDRFLSRFKLDVLDGAFKDAAAVQSSAVKFGLVSDREKWQFTMMAERSQINANAVFILRQLILRPVDPKSSFDQKYELAQSVVLRCYGALGLEWDVNAASP